MNLALLTAGGVGSRTGQNVPKQFLTVYDTPVIVYTMKNIEESRVFDEIYVICSDGWSEFIESYAKQYNIKSFKGTITGGNTRFQSILNGYVVLSLNHDLDDVVCVIDANRPLIPKEVFCNAIQSLENSDGVLPLEPCYDSMYTANKECMSVMENIDRDSLFKGQTPECARLGFILELTRRAAEEGLTSLTPTSIIIHYGYSVSFVTGSSKCFKITTADDFAIFKALIGDNIPKNLKC